MFCARSVERLAKVANNTAFSTNNTPSFHLVNVGGMEKEVRDVVVVVVE